MEVNICATIEKSKPAEKSSPIKQRVVLDKCKYPDNARLCSNYTASRLVDDVVPLDPELLSHRTRKTHNQNRRRERSHTPHQYSLAAPCNRSHDQLSVILGVIYSPPSIRGRLCYQHWFENIRMRRACPTDYCFVRKRPVRIFTRKSGERVADLFLDTLLTEQRRQKLLARYLRNNTTTFLEKPRELDITLRSLRYCARRKVARFRRVTTASIATADTRRHSIIALKTPGNGCVRSN